VCTVGRRASVAQGRALLSIWERSFAGALAERGVVAGAGGDADVNEALRGFSALLRSGSSANSNSNSTTTTTSSPRTPALTNGDSTHATTTTTTITPNDDPPLPPPVAAHLGPLFGAICSLAGLGLEQTAYVFMLGHVKALVSAAVRAGMFGPYQAQKTLASGAVQGLVAAVVEREWETKVEEAGQSVTVMDLWVGRHETLYSRIFNS
jgi:urease accessory protein